MGNSCSPGCRLWCLLLSFFPLDVLDGIWDLIESVSEGFLTYSCIGNYGQTRVYFSLIIKSFL